MLECPGAETTLEEELALPDLAVANTGGGNASRSDCCSRGGVLLLRTELAEKPCFRGEVWSGSCFLDDEEETEEGHREYAGRDGGVAYEDFEPVDNGLLNVGLAEARIGGGNSLLGDTDSRSSVRSSSIPSIRSTSSITPWVRDPKRCGVGERTGVRLRDGGPLECADMLRFALIGGRERSKVALPDVVFMYSPSKSPNIYASSRPR